MLLVIDIGNSNITLGVFDGDVLKVTARMRTERFKTGDQYAYELYNVLKIHDISPKSIEGCIVSSVVPTINGAIKKACRLVCSADPVFVGPGVKTGLNIKIDNPAQLGADLVVGAVAAKEKYALPCVILDMGTATTVSVLDGEGSYLGGTIGAGIYISLEALTSGTSQLPQVALETPPSVIGTNTVDCMKSGLVIGTAAMIDGIIDRIEDEVGNVASVVATGGLSGEVVKNCRRQIVVDDDLLLDGLHHIYNKNR